MAGDAVQLSDPIHRVSGPSTAWTRVNIAEGIPGVSTPLNWSHWDDADEYMIRQSYVDMGVLALPVPETDGGVGLGWVEAGLAFQALGHACVAGPYVSTAAATAASGEGRKPSAPATGPQLQSISL